MERKAPAKVAHMLFGHAPFSKKKQGCATFLVARGGAWLLQRGAPLQKNAGVRHFWVVGSGACLADQGAPLKKRLGFSTFLWKKVTHECCNRVRHSKWVTMHHFSWLQ